MSVCISLRQSPYGRKALSAKIMLNGKPQQRVRVGVGVQKRQAKRQRFTGVRHGKKGGLEPWWVPVAFLQPRV